MPEATKTEGKVNARAAEREKQAKWRHMLVNAELERKKNQVAATKTFKKKRKPETVIPAFLKDPEKKERPERVPTPDLNNKDELNDAQEYWGVDHDGVYAGNLMANDGMSARTPEEPEEEEEEETKSKFSIFQKMGMKAKLIAKLGGSIESRETEEKERPATPKFIAPPLQGTRRAKLASRLKSLADQALAVSAAAEFAQHKDEFLALVKKPRSERTPDDAVDMERSLAAFGAVFVDLDLASRLAVCSTLDYVFVKKNGAVFLEGDKGDRFYGILDGEVAVLRDRHERKGGPDHALAGMFGKKADERKFRRVQTVAHGGNSYVFERDIDGGDETEEAAAAAAAAAGEGEGEEEEDAADQLFPDDLVAPWEQPRKSRVSNEPPGEPTKEQIAAARDAQMQKILGRQNRERFNKASRAIFGKGRSARPSTGGRTSDGSGERARKGGACVFGAGKKMRDLHAQFPDAQVTEKYIRPPSPKELKGENPWTSTIPAALSGTAYAHAVVQEAARQLSTLMAASTAAARRARGRRRIERHQASSDMQEAADAARSLQRATSLPARIELTQELREALASAAEEKKSGRDSRPGSAASVVADVGLPLASDAGEGAEVAGDGGGGGGGGGDGGSSLGGSEAVGDGPPGDEAPLPTAENSRVRFSETDAAFPPRLGPRGDSEESSASAGGVHPPTGARQNAGAPKSLRMNMYKPGGAVGESSVPTTPPATEAGYGSRAGTPRAAGLSGPLNLLASFSGARAGDEGGDEGGGEEDSMLLAMEENRRMAVLEATLAKGDSLRRRSSEVASGSGFRGGGINRQMGQMGGLLAAPPQGQGEVAAAAERGAMRRTGPAPPPLGGRRSTEPAAAAAAAAAAGAVGAGAGAADGAGPGRRSTEGTGLAGLLGVGPRVSTDVEGAAAAALGLTPAKSALAGLLIPKFTRRVSIGRDEVPFEWRGRKLLLQRKLGSGKTFGDLALLHDSQRSATVVATEDCHLISLTRDAYQAVLAQSQADRVQQKIDFIHSVPTFSSLEGRWGYMPLCYGMEERTFPAGSVVVAQGAPSGGIYFVKEGAARVVVAFMIAARPHGKSRQAQAGHDRNGRSTVITHQVDICIVGPRQHFGEGSSLRDGVESCSYVAVDKLVCWVIPAAAVGTSVSKPAEEALLRDFDMKSEWRRGQSQSKMEAVISEFQHAASYRTCPGPAAYVGFTDRVQQRGGVLTAASINNPLLQPVPRPLKYASAKTDSQHLQPRSFAEELDVTVAAGSGYPSGSMTARLDASWPPTVTPRNGTMAAVGALVSGGSTPQPRASSVTYRAPGTAGTVGSVTFRADSSPGFLPDIGPMGSSAGTPRRPGGGELELSRSLPSRTWISSMGSTHSLGRTSRTAAMAGTSREASEGGGIEPEMWRKSPDWAAEGGLARRGPLGGALSVPIPPEHYRAGMATPAALRLAGLHLSGQLGCQAAPFSAADSGISIRIPRYEVYNLAVPHHTAKGRAAESRRVQRHLAHVAELNAGARAIVSESSAAQKTEGVLATGLLDTLEMSTWSYANRATRPATSAGLM